MTAPQPRDELADIIERASRDASMFFSPLSDAELIADRILAGGWRRMTVDPNPLPHAYIEGTLPGILGRLPPCKKCVRDEGHYIHAAHKLEAAQQEIKRLTREVTRLKREASEWQQEAARHLGNHLTAEGRYEEIKYQRDTWWPMLITALTVGARQREALEAKLAKVPRPFVRWANVKAKKAAIDKANGRNP